MCIYLTYDINPLIICAFILSQINHTTFTVDPLSTQPKTRIPPTMAPEAGRVAIVTGSSSGMGQDLARGLVQRGWKVALADINENVGLSKELGESAAFFKCDVADYDSQAKTFQGAWDKWGRIDALCANAGIVDRR